MEQQAVQWLLIERYYVKQHKISLTSAILMNINIMVGSGILIGPGIMAAISGNASFLSWLIVALVFLPLVLTTVKMSRMCPGSGGFYAYAKEGLSKEAAYFAGWMYISGYTFVVAVEILALRQVLTGSLGPDWAWFTGNLILYNAVLSTSIVALNLLSLKIFTRILNTFTITKMVPIIVLILLIPFIINPGFTVTAGEVKLLPLALPMAIFGYFGFEYTCSISHLVENSERNAPLAILIGFLTTALLYALFHFGLLNLMGVDGLAKDGASLYAQYITLPLPALKMLLNIIIPVAAGLILFAGANGLLNANSIMMHSMASEKLFHFWEPLSKVSVVHRPWVAIVIQGVITFVIATLIPYVEVVGGLANTGIAGSFILPFWSLLGVQRRTGRHGSPALTILALVIAFLLTAYSIYRLAPTVTERIIYVLPLLGLLAVGAFLYRRNRVEANA